MSMRVTFLGTSGAVPTTERAPSALLVEREGERLLFDCGEGTQRRMMRFGTGFTISHLFVTHLHGDHVLGIPGLVQTLDFNGREDPLAVHGPPGSKPHLRDLIEAGGYTPSFPITINEIRPGTVAVDAADYEVRTFETDHRNVSSTGYAIVEDDRRGRFDRDRAEELGVPVGPKFGRLHDGDPVELDDGTVVRPEQVVGDPRPGRRFVYTGDTRPVDATVAAAADPDLLVHDATFDAEWAGRARRTGHSTGREAAEVATRAGATRLALVHVSSRYAGDASPIERDAVETTGDGVEVSLPDDGHTIAVPYPDEG